MVEQYNQKIREAGLDNRKRELARLELAYFCRHGAEQLIVRGYKGTIVLGQPINSLLPFSYFSLEDRKVYQKNLVSTLFKWSAWKFILPESWFNWMAREASLREIPFERYNSDTLLEIAKDVEKAQKSLPDNSLRLPTV